MTNRLNFLISFKYFCKLSKKKYTKVIIDTYNNKNENKIINKPEDKPRSESTYIHQHMHDQTNKTKQDKKKEQEEERKKHLSIRTLSYTNVCLWRGTYMEFMFPFKPVLNNFIVKNAENTLADLQIHTQSIKKEEK